MAISRKPKPQTTSTNDVDVAALIAKGGSVASASEELQSTTQVTTDSNENGGKETASFTLRVPSDLLQALDEHRRTQPYKVPRQQWILEAIVQRLEREILKPKEESSNIGNQP